MSNFPSACHVQSHSFFMHLIYQRFYLLLFMFVVEENASNSHDSILRRRINRKRAWHMKRGIKENRMRETLLEKTRIWEAGERDSFHEWKWEEKDLSWSQTHTLQEIICRWDAREGRKSKDGLTRDRQPDEGWIWFSRESESHSSHEEEQKSSHKLMHRFIIHWLKEIRLTWITPSCSLTAKEERIVLYSVVTIDYFST